MARRKSSHFFIPYEIVCLLVLILKVEILVSTRRDFQIGHYHAHPED